MLIDKSVWLKTKNFLLPKISGSELGFNNGRIKGVVGKKWPLAWNNAFLKTLDLQLDVYVWLDTLEDELSIGTEL